MEIGTRVIVSMDKLIADKDNAWLLNRIKAGSLSSMMTGTIKRHADCGTTGIEFDIDFVKIKDNHTYNISDLHGTGKKGYCLYIQRKYYKKVEELEDLAEDAHNGPRPEDFGLMPFVSDDDCAICC